MNVFPTQEKRNVFLTEVLRKLNAVPGVSEAALGGPNTPFTRVPNLAPIEIQGRVATPGEVPTAEIGVTSPAVFHTLGMSLLRGRLFTESDGPKGEQVVVIDETAAAQFWPNEDAVGKQIRLLRRSQAAVEAGDWRRRPQPQQWAGRSLYAASVLFSVAGTVECVDGLRADDVLCGCIG